MHTASEDQNNVNIVVLPGGYFTKGGLVFKPGFNEYPGLIYPGLGLNGFHES